MQTFSDGELLATLPDASKVYHVDGPGSGIPGHVSKVDWAWREPYRHFICELKDPECSGAQKYQPSAAADMRLELIGTGFPSKLADKAHQTTIHHKPTAERKRRVYIVMAAISTLTAADMLAAQTSIERQLASLNLEMKVIVVNLHFWNQLLTPRTMVRQ